MLILSTNKGSQIRGEGVSRILSGHLRLALNTWSEARDSSRLAVQALCWLYVSLYVRYVISGDSIREGDAK